MLQTLMFKLKPLSVDPEGGRNSNKTKPMVHKLGVTLEELYNGKVCCKWWADDWISSACKYGSQKSMSIKMILAKNADEWWQSNRRGSLRRQGTESATTAGEKEEPTSKAAPAARGGGSRYRPSRFGREKEEGEKWWSCFFSDGPWYGAAEPGCVRWVRRERRDHSSKQQVDITTFLHRCPISPLSSSASLSSLLLSPSIQRRDHSSQQQLDITLIIKDHHVIR